MEKLKIAITQIGTDNTNNNLIHQVCCDPVMLELCTPVELDEETAYRELDKAKVDALVLTSEAKCPSGAFEIIVTDKTNIAVLDKEPTAEDIIRLRNILERDFDLQIPRIAIVQESIMQNPDLATQVTTEQGINTYGPYTVEQITAEDTAWHFDGIITTDKVLAQRIVTDLLAKAPVRYFAGREAVVTAIYQPVQTNEDEGVADVSWLTHPFFTAIDIIRNRAFYDEARQDVLPKLFRDKREDRKKDELSQTNTNNDNSEKAS